MMLKAYSVQVDDISVLIISGSVGTSTFKDIVKSFFIHRLQFLITNRHTRAQVVHNSGLVLVSASTTEFEISRHLYKTTDVTAARNIGRVIAQRCLEAGIARVRWEAMKGGLRKQRVTEAAKIDMPS